ncbi:MAG: FtsX-like permease family protein, partial [Coriobacteriia bacterium]|nr:FtsX-like permease family protein [Coriobacteriia bacterium]
EGENPPVDPENPGEGEDPPVNPSEPSVEEQLAELQQALAAAQGFLASLQEQKSQAEAQLESGRAEAEGYLAQINAGIAEIESLNISEAQLNAGEAEALDGLQQIDDAIAQIQDGAAQLDEAIEELEDGWRSYYENKALAEQEFIDARQKLIDSRKTLNKAKADLAKGEQEYQDGLKEFEEQKVKAEDDIAAAQNKLDEAREEINDIDDAKWYILSRAANPTYATYEANAQRMEQITNIFPIFFFLVAALVSLTTMTRMVESERIEIGTYKALGYTNGAIALKYLAFAGLASVLGAGIGIAVGIYVMPKVIWQSYSVIYTNVEFLVEPHAKDMIIAFVASVSIALIATFSAVRISLRERPSALMLPRAPKPGKRIFLERITPIWNRMHFTAKVTARNLFRYKKRMIMTVIGIAGCTALLITGFGIKDALGDFVTRQFDNIYLYNEIIGVDTGADPQSKTADKNSMAARAMKEQYPEGKWAFFANVAAIASNPDGDPEDIPFTVGGETARTGNSVQAQLRNAEASNIDASEEKSGIIRDTAIIVPEDGANLSNFYNLLDYKTLEPINLQANEVAMTEKLAENLLIKPGDTFMLSLGEGEEEIEVTLDKIVHYYIGNAIFMRQDAYTSIFDEAAEYNIILNYSEDISDRAKISNKLNESPAITSITFPEDLTTNYTNLTDSLDMLIILVIFVSGSLAFIVLFNLTNINIEERNSEIATIKVLGFFNKEVNSYVFRETFILSVMGTILGIPLGYLLCTFIMRSAEIDDLMFIRQISPLSYFLSVAITLVFTLIVIVFMSYKLKKIDMAASLKAVD